MLSINISELVLTLLSFFVLMFLLNRLLFKPVISFQKQRQQRIDEGQELKRQAQAKQELFSRELEQQRSESVKEAGELEQKAYDRAREQLEQEEKRLEEERVQQQERNEQEALALKQQSLEAVRLKQQELARALADKLSK